MCLPRYRCFGEWVLRSVGRAIRSHSGQIPAGRTGRRYVGDMAHVPRRPGSPPAADRVTAALALAIVVGMVMLWPHDVQQRTGAELLRQGEVVEAEGDGDRCSPCGANRRFEHADSLGNVPRRSTGPVIARLCDPATVQSTSPPARASHPSAIASFRALVVTARSSIRIAAYASESPSEPLGESTGEFRAATWQGPP